MHMRIVTFLIHLLNEYNFTTIRNCVILKAADFTQKISRSTICAVIKTGWTLGIVYAE